MIVGRGLIARAFAEYEENEEICLFASGVSDSTCTDPAQFQREKDLMKSNLADFKGTFIYFSTISITDQSLKERPYTVHKKAMEELVRGSSSYLICRLPFVVGPGGNPKTILNFLVESVRCGKAFQLWTKAERNFLDVEDVVALVRFMLEDKDSCRTVSVMSPNNYSIQEVVENVERFLGRDAVYEPKELGGPIDIDTSAIDSYLPRLPWIAQEDYLWRLLTKYYSV